MATRITRMRPIWADFLWIVGCIGCEGGLRPVCDECAWGDCDGGCAVWAEFGGLGD
jgi:hypothetical protein